MATKKQTRFHLKEEFALCLMLDYDVVYHISLFEITCHKGSHVVSLTLEKRDILFLNIF